MDISAWLRELGLERYEQAFRENEIDAEILPRLTADDLKDIGVTIVGHRRKLLEAIAALSPKPDEAPADVPSAERFRAREAERRQLTVMFVDLVGSTALAAQLDPEDMRQVITAYQNACTEVITRFEGHVAKYMGDGVLAYFGYPQAHEDDGERAVRAGLELAEAVGRQTANGEALAVRVGIATGQVVVGDLIGAGAAQEEAVVGETPNLAARLQSLAEPGGVVIAPTTRHLLGGLFEVSDIGEHDLKGFAAPVQVWRVLGESPAESRFEALRGRQLTALVGREHELGLLVDRWDCAREGEGQVVLMSGEPGIGKSRIVGALREHLVGQPYTPLSHFCSPHHTNSALHPVIRLLRRAAGFDRDDRADARLDKLEALLSRGTDRLDEALPLVAALLEIGTGERYPPLALSPQNQKQRTLEVLIDQIEGLAAEAPVLAVYEDVHWIDPSTLDLLGHLIERSQRFRVLVLITARPEFVSPWMGQPHLTQLSLSRLTRRHAGALVAGLTADRPLPSPVQDQIVAKADGVPLFAEELTKTVLESGLLREAKDRYELASPLPSLAIPTTLHDSLMARLDRLAAAKEIAQIAAVIGREFSQALLAALTERDDAELSVSLDQLIASGLVFRREVSPDTTYVFKHALVQDAAYQSLLRSQRQILHLRIAEALERQFPKRVAGEPELLAYHFAAAQEVGRALTYLERAATRAIERSGNVEAVAHLQNALELCARLPEADERDQRELRLRLTLGPALMLVRGWSAPEVRQSYEKARALCRSAGPGRDLFLATWGMWMHHQARAEHRQARPLTEELLAAAAASHDPGLRLQSHHATWTTCLYTGELEAAIDHCRCGLELYDIKQHGDHAFSFAGHDPGVCGYGQGALMHWLRGYPDQAAAMSEAAVDLARRLGHGASSAHALQFAARLHSMRRDYGAARQVGEACIALAEELSLPVALSCGIIVKGWAETMDRGREDSLDAVKRAFEMRQEILAGSAEPFFLALWAEAHMAAGHFEEAERIVAEAIRFAEEKGERSWEAELFRLRGELRRRVAEVDLKRADFERALEISRTQHARSLELRAATSLARLWADQGERQKAFDLLAPIYNWFAEGFDTADLRDAKALLDEPT